MSSIVKDWLFAAVILVVSSVMLFLLSSGTLVILESVY